jgi:DNA-binding MarR family transcriptional regulator
MGYLICRLPFNLFGFVGAFLSREMPVEWNCFVPPESLSPAQLTFDKVGKRRYGSVRCTPSNWETPVKENECLDDPMMKLAGRLIRVVASTHLWSIDETRRLEGNSLTYSQVVVLYQVREGVTTPGAIARRLGITPRAITKTVDQLEAQGMLQRVGDGSDRRKVRLVLTEAGRYASEDVECRALGPMAHRLDALSEPERNRLIEGMEILESIVRSLKG